MIIRGRNPLRWSEAVAGMDFQVSVNLFEQELTEETESKCSVASVYSVDSHYFSTHW